MGISSMNGVTDEADETVRSRTSGRSAPTPQQHHLARFTFWSVNRDRPCGPNGSADAAAASPQEPWAFTTMIARFNG